VENCLVKNTAMRQDFFLFLLGDTGQKKEVNLCLVSYSIRQKDETANEMNSRFYCKCISISIACSDFMFFFVRSEFLSIKKYSVN